MPAKYRQGDDLLRMLAHVYNPICVWDSGGDFKRQKPFVSLSTRKIALEKPSRPANNIFILLLLSSKIYRKFF